MRKAVTACLGEASHITRLEHVQARLTLSYNRRGDLAIHLVSPMGTRSTLLAARCLPCPLHSLFSLVPGCLSHSPVVTRRAQRGTVGVLGGMVWSHGAVPRARNP